MQAVLFDRISALFGVSQTRRRNRKGSSGLVTKEGDGDSRVNELGRRVGNALVVRQSDVEADSTDVDAGFYAIAYEWNGETIISYRGSDFNGDIVADIVNGWPIGAGVSSAAQADLAIGSFENASTALWRAAA